MMAAVEAARADVRDADASGIMQGPDWCREEGSSPAIAMMLPALAKSNRLCINC
jgi:hypothetical protein